MPGVESKAIAGAPAAAAAPARAGGGSQLRRIAAYVVAICAAAALLIAAGFGWFVWRLPTDEIALDRNVDGIVVLTGGASRILGAMELLAAGRGKRLLISGAYNPAITSGEISRLNPRYGRIVGCCVDFDHAPNTVGNAIETRQWALSHGFQSLIVVTSNYHMPRALAEIAHQLPDMTLVPFPVIADKGHAEPWWAHATTARLMFLEYLKYLAARARIWLDPSLMAGLPDKTGIRAY